MRSVAASRRERGASLVEFAFIAPLMVLLVMGVLDLGRAYRMDIRLENAAREGAAFGQLFPNKVDCGSSLDIHERVSDEEPGVATSPSFTITVIGIDEGAETEIVGCNSGIAHPGERLRVEVSAEYQVMTPVVSQVVGKSIEMTGAAEVRVQGQVEP